MHFAFLLHTFILAAASHNYQSKINPNITFNPVAAQYLFSCLVIPASPTIPLQLQVLPSWPAVLAMPEQAAYTQGFLFVLRYMLQHVLNTIWCAPLLESARFPTASSNIVFTPGWGQKHAWVFAENTYWNSKKIHTVTWLAWKLPWEPLPVSSVIQSSLQEF